MNAEEKQVWIKRLQYRANHRGIKEMDIILGSFADQELRSLDNAQIADFESLMQEHDRDLLVWFTDEAEFPLNGLQSIFDLVKTHMLQRKFDA